MRISFNPKRFPIRRCLALVEDPSLWRNFDVGFHFGRNFQYKPAFLERWVFPPAEESVVTLPPNGAESDPLQGAVLCNDSSGVVTPLSNVADFHYDDSPAVICNRDLKFRFISADPSHLTESVKSLVRLGRRAISGILVDFRGWGSKTDVESVVSSLPWLLEPASTLQKIEIVCDPETASVINAIDFVERLFLVTCSDRSAANPCLHLRG